MKNKISPTKKFIAVALISLTALALAFLALKNLKEMFSIGATSPYAYMTIAEARQAFIDQGSMNVIIPDSRLLGVNESSTCTLSNREPPYSRYYLGIINRPGLQFSIDGYLRAEIPLNNYFVIEKPVANIKYKGVPIQFESIDYSDKLTGEPINNSDIWGGRMNESGAFANNIDYIFEFNQCRYRVFARIYIPPDGYAVDTPQLQIPSNIRDIIDLDELVEDAEDSLFAIVKNIIDKGLETNEEQN